MSILRLRFLGGFSVKFPSGEAAEITIRKGQALLAYLALNPGEDIPRAKLTGMLWGDRGEAQAKSSLRQTLTVLRKALAPLGAEILHADRRLVRIDRDYIDVDAVSFQELYFRGAPADLENAVALYRGDLLDGLEIPDPGFQEWLDGERQRLQNRWQRRSLR